MTHALIPKSLYGQDALTVARALLGAHIVRGPVRLRITEVEAYRWPDDSANHCRAGRTKRNAPMWGPPGRAYVYLCYGLHNMLNFVTNPKGQGAAVLVRACEPLDGLEVIQRRRGGKEGPVLLTGPGKVGAALGLDTTWSHHPLYRSGELEVRWGTPPDRALAGPRVGIGY
ncbi:MAG: DNA-3-methyladenine glycosylase, partial [Myxococcota bacterium]|nr:DNA-3-methyladenine glycosylase [Myxococcota bacterium]